MSSFIVGLTGGIGSGKSTVANLFVAEGAGLVDTDAIAHELTSSGGQAMPLLLQEFGPDIAKADGSLDRVAMREQVFGDSAARAKLEGILHPMIRKVSAARCIESLAPYVILAVPLLVEAGNYRERCDRIIVVDCPESMQIERVIRRNGLSVQQVNAIIATQASREQRLAVADDVVSNTGGLERLHEQIVQLHQYYLSLSAEKVAANG